MYASLKCFYNLPKNEINFKCDCAGQVCDSMNAISEAVVNILTWISSLAAQKAPESLNHGDL